MRTGWPRFSPAVFGIIVICFFLPFVQVTCSGQKLISFSGIELASGKKIELPSGIDPSQLKMQKTEPELYAILALAVAILGLIFSFVLNIGARILALLGGAGAVFLFLLRSKILDESGNNDLLIIQFDFGFWLALILSILALLINLIPNQRNEHSPPQF